MRLKSYFAQSIGDAIESARQELGPEAMLLNSRKTSPEQNYLGEYEVVFGITGNPPAQKKSPAGERPLSTKLSGTKRIFPDLIAPEAPEPASSEEQVVVPANVAGRKRIFPELVRPEPAKPETLEAETPIVVEVAATSRLPTEVAMIETATVLVAEVETPVATKPLFPKASTPAPAPSVPSPDSSTVAAPKASALEVCAVPAPEKQPEISSAQDIAHELAELRKQLQAVSQSIAEGLESRWNTPRKVSVVDHLFSRLLAFDFSEEFSRDLIGSAAQSKMTEYESILRNVHSSTPAAPAPSSKSILTQVKSRFAVDPGVGKAGAQRNVVMFVGPPGAGKTTSIVKLAVQLGLEQELPIHLLSLDTFRVAGSEQLNAFGRILGVGFTALHTPEALAGALEEHRDKKLILIDTPGYAAADKEEMEKTAAFFRNHEEVEVQLVLPATLRTSALRKFVGRFSAFQPSKIIYTHLDEVETLGPVVENTIAAGLPISFLADGQSIPQDLHEATKDRLLEGLFANARAAALSAA
jgi:flagellar biosynthesis protein FlhF